VAPPSSFATAVSCELPTEAAIRWRINAAIFDNLLVYAAYLGVCLAMRWRVADPGHLLVLISLTVVYHWALESRGGQTLGKRRYGIRVEALGGGPASTRAIALRSLLRIVDQLPLCYCSGLISVVRTGPSRRQRIGDVVGETVVVAVDGHSRERGTAGWVLPASTIVATLASAAFVFAIFAGGAAQLTSAQRAEFIAGCDASSHGLVDCGCALDSLEAHGYDTQSSLQTLFEQEQSAVATRNPAALPAAFIEAVNDCRR
jgi:uncharacterized RDD family membrane protein YckC